MTSYERMAMLLKGTGIYAMKAGDLVDGETRCYGRAIETLLGEVQTAFQMIFFDDLDNLYYADHERLFGLPVTTFDINGLDVETRVQKIEAMKKRLQVNHQLFDQQTLDLALQSYGIVATVRAEGTAVTITIQEDRGYVASAAHREALLYTLFPVGVTLTVVG